MVDPASAVTLALGVGAVVTAFGGREVHRLRHRARLVSGLASPIPKERMDAADALITLGLAAAARPLLAGMQREEDPQVRVGVALTLGRRQWEPGNGRRAAEMRDWAQAELSAHGFEVMPFGPAFTRLSDMGGPRLPQTEQHKGGTGVLPLLLPPQLDGTLGAPDVAADVAADASLPNVVAPEVVS